MKTAPTMCFRTRNGKRWLLGRGDEVPRHVWYCGRKPSWRLPRAKRMRTLPRNSAPRSRRSEAGEPDSPVADGGNRKGCFSSRTHARHFGGDGDADRPQDHAGEARSRHALEYAVDGQSDGREQGHRASGMGGPRPEAAFDAEFQAQQRSPFCGKVGGRGGAVPRSPEHALVLCADEKTSIQALDRTQRGLPIHRGRCGTMTHDYKCNGTTTLFAAIDMTEGRLIGTCMSKHRHQEWISS